MSSAPNELDSTLALQSAANAFAVQALIEGKLDQEAFKSTFSNGFSAAGRFFAMCYVETLTNLAANPASTKGLTDTEVATRFEQGIAPLDPTTAAYAANRLKEKRTPGGVALRDRATQFQSLQSEAGHVPVPESLGIEQGSARKRLPTGSKLLEDLAHMFALVAMVHGKLDEQAFGRVYQGGLSASAQFFAKTYAEALVNTALHPALVKRFTPEELAERFAQGIALLDPVMAAFATSQLQESKVSTLFPDLAKATAGFQAISQAQSGSVPNPEHLGISIESLNQSEAVAPGGDIIVNLMMVKRALEKEGYSEHSLSILKARPQDLEPLQPLLDLYARQRKQGVSSTVGQGEETKLADHPITLSQVERAVGGVIRGKQMDAVLATLALAAWRQSRSDPGSPDAVHHRIRLAECLRSP